jgi:hypothetical protein
MSEFQPPIYFGDITVNTINGAAYPPPVPESLIITGKDIDDDGCYCYVVNTPDYVYPLLLACYIDEEQYFPDVCVNDKNMHVINFGRNSKISEKSKIKLVFIKQPILKELK